MTFDATYLDDLTPVGWNPERIETRRPRPRDHREKKASVDIDPSYGSEARSESGYRIWNSPGYISDRLYGKLRKTLPDAIDGTFSAHFGKLLAIQTDATLTPDGADQPSPIALGWAKSILLHLQGQAMLPTKVVSSAEGGVAICFVSGDCYSDIECLNEGSILGVISNRRDRPIVWHIGPNQREFARASTRIREFFDHARPKRMLRRDRGVDPNFRPVHCLYYRFKSKILWRGASNPARLRALDISVNWSNI